jgi:N-acetylglucosamine kinase-like BadF-type ATPase
VLGIDGGGTSTHAWLASPGQRILGRGRAGPSNAKAVGLEAAHRALDNAITTAFHDSGRPREPVAVACLGLAGFDRPADREILESWSHEDDWAERLVLANDGDLVVAAGTAEGWGIGLIAGTGSIAVGRAADGRTARAGGWGHLIGDEGSAYWVVLESLRQVVRRADGREPARPDTDPLRERLCRALGVSTPSEIVSALYAPGIDRTLIAALAPEVLAAAGEDAKVFEEVLAPAANALAEQVAAVARALHWPEGPLPLAYAGGFLLSARAVAQRMIENLASRGYSVVAQPVPEPVRGAVLLAERSLALMKT